MKKSIHQLESIIATYSSLLQLLDEQKTSYKPLPNKWSKKELIGHLIDSAQSNIRRFIVAQYETKPNIVYAQDHWVIAAGYQNYPLADLVHFWILINKHAVRVLKNVPGDMLQNEVQTQELHSIEWLAADYNKHLLHHLHQILEMEEMPYP